LRELGKRSGWGDGGSQNLSTLLLTDSVALPYSQ
jgi:hypothetical protein